MTVTPLRLQLRGSLDLIDAGAALRDAGTALQSAGCTVMLLQEAPSQHIINELTGVAHAIVGVIETLAKARDAR